MDQLAGELGVRADEIMSWDAMTHDTNRACLSGWHEEFISAPRLDNLCSSHAAVTTLVEASSGADAGDSVPVICLFDHEEVGSGSRSGAESPILSDVIERSVLARGGDRETLQRALAASVCVSADMADDTHPNYASKLEPGHHLAMNGGTVIKINSNQRYATEAETAAHFELCCLAAEPTAGPHSPNIVRPRWRRSSPPWSRFASVQAPLGPSRPRQMEHWARSPPPVAPQLLSDATSLGPSHKPPD